MQTSVCFAQEISFGLRAGMTRSSLAKNFAEFADKESISGLTGGVYLKAKFLGFFIMPEAVYNQRGFEIATIGSGTIHYVDVPILAGKQVLKFFRVNAGPNFQFAFSKDLSELNGYKNNTNFNDFVVGLQAGAGIDIWKISIDLRYDMSISNTTEINMIAPQNLQLPDVKYSSRSSMWQLILGYRLIQITQNNFCILLY